MVKVQRQLIWLSCYAYSVWARDHYSTWHLYGHSHHTLPDDTNALSLNIGVDATAVRLGRPDLYGSGTVPETGLKPEDYRPMHFDEIAELMKRKAFVLVDHHRDWSSGNQFHIRGNTHKTLKQESKMLQSFAEDSTSVMCRPYASSRFSMD